MAKLTPTTHADKWLKQGIEESALARRKFRECWSHMLNAGMFFLKAQESCKEGNFELLLETYEADVSRATVYRHMAATRDAMEWAAASNPALKNDPTRLFEQAKKMVLQSPREFVAICRQLGEMRKFGEYDAIKYARRKLLGDEQQMELDFGKARASLEILERIDQIEFTNLPDGVTIETALDEVEHKLENALEKVRERRKTVSV